MKVCPTCGTPLPGSVHVGGKRRQAVFDYIRERPHGVSSEQIVGYVYADDPNGGPDCAATVISVVVCRINHILAGLDYPLRISGTGGPGSIYRMVPPDKMFRKFDEAERRSIAAMEGGAVEVARAVGVTHSTINRWRKRYGGETCAS